MRRVLPPSGLKVYLTHCLRRVPELVRSRSLECIDARMDGIQELTYRGAKLHINLGVVDSLLPTGDAPTFSGIREMYARDVYLRFFRPERLRWKDVVDAGANRGLFSLFAATLAERVFWVEAQEAYLEAFRSLLVGHALHAEVVPVVGTLRPDNVAIPLPLTWTAIMPPGTGDNGFSMSELLTRYGMKSVSFLKMDIEGAEFPVLKCSSPWLGAVENIAMEVHAEAGNPNEIVDLLRSAGFAVTAADSDLHRVGKDGLASYVYASRTGTLR